MGHKEIKAVGWTSSDLNLRIRVTAVGRNLTGPNAGRVKYIWTINKARENYLTDLVWSSNDNGEDGAIYGGVGAPMDCTEGIKTLVVFLDAWHEAMHGPYSEESENANLFGAHHKAEMLEVVDEYHDEMYADLAMDD